jgi:hypothetical protein
MSMVTDDDAAAPSFAVKFVDKRGAHSFYRIAQKTESLRWSRHCAFTREFGS